MADKRISQLIERTDIANNDVLPIVASGATTTNKVTISTIQDWMQENLDVGVTSVGLSMPSAFTVSNSPVTTSGNISVTGAGTVAQYIRGDGSLADFPSSTGGGSSVSYYLNGSVNQGTIGGIAYRELSKSPIFGAGTDFTINADGYIASFITDAGDPNLLLIPAGNWNFETYLQASSGGGSPTFYIELYKVSGSTATLIASNSGSPELIAFGTNINPYFSALAVPETTLALTDRLAIRYYVAHSGRTITLHTENNTLCQIITTFTTGLTALNGLTAQVQNFATGTSGTDFNISSASTTHTFNIPSASTTARGLITTGSQTIGGSKTFQNHVLANDFFYIREQIATTLLANYTQIYANSTHFGFNNGAGTASAVFTYNGIANYTLPSTSGTLALTSNLSAYLPLTGGTLTGALNGTSATFTAAGSTFVSATTTGGSDMRISSGATTGFVGTTSNHPLSFVVNNAVVATIAVGGAATFSSSVNAGQLFLSTPSNLVGNINSTNTNGGALTWQTNGTIIADIGTAQMLFGTGGADTFGINARGSRSLILGTNNTARLTINSSGAATFSSSVSATTANLIPTGGNPALNITASGSAPSIELRGNTDNITALNFFNNAGTTLQHYILSTPSAFNLSSQGNTPLTFGTNAGGGGGTRMTISGSGDVTLTGALNGTSASFTGDLTSNGELRVSNNAGLTFLQLVNSSAGGRNFTLISSGASNPHSIAAGNFYLRNSTTGTNPLIIDGSNGAATFSSSVTAGGSVSITDGQYFIYDTRADANNRNWVLLSNAVNFGDFAIRQSNAKDGNPLTAGTDRFYISRLGNVGIGTASPGAILHTLTSSANGGIIATSSATTLYTEYRVNTSTTVGLLGNGNGILSGGGNGNFGIRAEDSLLFAAGGNNERMRITSSGGIAYRGESNVNSQVFLSNDNSLFRLYAGDSSASTKGFAFFVTNGSTQPEAMRITSGGNVLIANAGQTDGALIVGRNGNNNSILAVSDANNTSEAYFRGYSTSVSASRIVIFSNGNIVNSNNSYGALSDIKIKENITDATPKLEDLLKVKVRNYNLIGEETKQIGVIAQELEEIFPAMIDESEDFEEVQVPQLDEEGNEVLNEEGEVVTTKERVSKGTTTKSVKYSVFVPMLIKAIQEQQEIINEMRAEIDLLKTK
jgi:hypothetical protein